jgi:hypothetical protein
MPIDESWRQQSTTNTVVLLWKEAWKKMRKKQPVKAIAEHFLFVLLQNSKNEREKIVINQKKHFFKLK